MRETLGPGGRVEILVVDDGSGGTGTAVMDIVVDPATGPGGGVLPPTDPTDPTDPMDPQIGGCGGSCGPMGAAQMLLSDDEGTLPADQARRGT